MTSDTQQVQTNHFIT